MNRGSFSVPPRENSGLKKAITDRLDRLTKPPGSLGRLEELALRFCLCRGRKDAEIARMEVFTFAGDHGITDERITPYPSDVTYQMVLNMVNGGAAVTVMCRKAGIDCVVVDMGVKGDFRNSPVLLAKKIQPGTKNFLKEPAMSEGDCKKAIKIGMDLADRSKADLIGIGEMGIGNTSAASALYSLILDADPDETVGPGTGSSGPLLERKKQVIREAVLFHKKDWNQSPLDALRRVGGFEIAGMAGMLFGAARRRIPAVVDGFVACAAALVAMRMEPGLRPYLFFSHVSAETYHGTFLEKEGIRPILSLDMRLGEGTGSVLAMQIIAQAMECYHRMATFESAGVSSTHAA
jgi:nicotinate-nucleotide--dimethylbenzimidazole phosphoribosyltransferase